MKNVELMEKFLLELSPDSAHQAIHSIFVSMRTMPVPTVMQGIGALAETIRREGTEEGAAVVNGLVIGVAMAYGLQHSTDLKTCIENFVSDAEKRRGKNVIGFAQARAGKIK